MINIVVVGAGEVGLYIAAMLSQQQHNMILVDHNADKLDLVRNLDVATRLGSGTDWQLLDDLLENTPDLLIALTDKDETNLVCCSIAKHLGYPRTIARVHDNNFLNRMRLDFGRLFDVDYFIGPELLVANDILEYVLSPGSLVVDSFAHGAVQLRTIEVPEKWRQGDKTLKELKLPDGVIVGLIARKSEDKGSGNGSAAMRAIFPHGNDQILPGDEVTLIGNINVVADMHHFFGISPKVIKSVVIVGGSLTAVNLAKLLEFRSIDIRIIEKDYHTCAMLADKLPFCTIMHYDACDVDFLRSEKIGSADLIVTLTNNDDTNVMAAVLGKEVGCDKAIAMITNRSYFSFLNRIGIDYALSPRVCAADHILSQLLSGTVTSLVSLYGNQAEVMEVNVSMNSPLLGIPLSELGPLLPQDLLIAMIQNRGRIMIAHGNRIISPGDTVVLITNPKHLSELEKIF